jgi:hypothetical protein
VYRPIEVKRDSIHIHIYIEYTAASYRERAVEMRGRETECNSVMITIIYNYYYICSYFVSEKKFGFLKRFVSSCGSAIP